jgi:putative redox protein
MDLITVAPKTASAYAIRVRGHEVICDMSEKEGGRDEGPSPVELLAGSLGACIAMMVGRYCQNHGWNDGKVGVDLTLELADDPKRVKGIVADLEVPKDVPPERIEAIRRMAGFCVVHQTLKNPPDVDIDVTQ